MTGLFHFAANYDAYISPGLAAILGGGGLVALLKARSESRNLDVQAARVDADRLREVYSASITRLESDLSATRAELVDAREELHGFRKQVRELEDRLELRDENLRQLLDERRGA